MKELYLFYRILCTTSKVNSVKKGKLCIEYMHKNTYLCAETNLEYKVSGCLSQLKLSFHTSLINIFLDNILLSFHYNNNNNNNNNNKVDL